MELKDKLKIMKILSSEEGREKFKFMFELKFKSQQAQQATAKCIAESLKQASDLEELTVSSGENGFLPLSVNAVAHGSSWSVGCVQPEDADFDYDTICAQFNELAEENPDEKTEFLQKTAALLEGMLNENGNCSEGFSIQIC